MTIVDHYAFDTETHAFTAGNIAPKLVVMSLFRPNHTAPSLYLRKDVEEVFNDMLDSKIPIVAHNAAFDMAVLMSNFPRLLRKIFKAYNDDQIRCSLIREALYLIALGEMGENRKALSLANTYFRRKGKILGGKEGPDEIRTKFGQLENTPLDQWPAEYVAYAVKDATVASELFVTQEDLPDEANQTRAAFALHLMAATGIRADAEKTHQLRKTLEARIVKSTEFLVPTGLVRPTGKRHMKAIRAEVERQYKAMDLPVPYSVRKENYRQRMAREEKEAKKREIDPNWQPKPPNIATKKAVLKDTECVDGRCIDKEFVLCKNPLHVLKSKNEDSREISSYVKHLEMACRTPINYTVTSLVNTGRTAVSNPPLQQMPKRIGVRQCIVPPEGYYFIGADFSAIELTTLGQILLDMFGKSLLAETIQAKKDPHSLTASMLLGITYEEAVARKESKDDEVQKEFNWYRDLSKALAFGVPGGLGAESFLSFAKGYGVHFEGTRKQQIETVKGYIKKYLDWYPEIRRYLNVISEQCGERGGRFTMAQPRSGRIRGNVGYTDGANSPFQGLAADLAKDAIWRITQECFIPGSPLFMCRVTLFMHDEIILQAPCEIAAEAAERVSQLMLEAAKRWCPDVPTKAEPWISMWWDKRAKPVRDANGRLIPWVPKTAA